MRVVETDRFRLIILVDIPDRRYPNLAAGIALRRKIQTHVGDDSVDRGCLVDDAAGPDTVDNLAGRCARTNLVSISWRPMID